MLAAYFRVLRMLADADAGSLPLPRTYPRENPGCTLDEKEVDMFRAYYSGIMYKVGTECGRLRLNLDWQSPAVSFRSLRRFTDKCMCRHIFSGHPRGDAALLCCHQGARRQPHLHGHLLPGAPLL